MSFFDFLATAIQIRNMAIHKDTLYNNLFRSEFAYIFLYLHCVGVRLVGNLLLSAICHCQNLCKQYKVLVQVLYLNDRSSLLLTNCVTQPTGS